jgi:hypothetical protein
VDVILLATYLAISPVYWLPGLPPATLRSVKFGIIIAAVTMIWFRRLLPSLQLSFPAGLLGPAGFLAIVLLSIPGIYQAEAAESARTLLDFTMCFAMLWTVYFGAGSGWSMPRALFWSALMLAGICSLVVSNALIGWPDWRPPAEFDTHLLSTAGFGARRTGWSNGISLFLPLLFIPLVDPAFRPTRRVLVGAIALLGVCAIVGAQMVVAGRAGLLSSIIALTLLTWNLLPRFRSLASAALVLSVLYLLVSAVSHTGGTDIAMPRKTNDAKESAAAHLRLDRIEDSHDFTSVDRFSAGRLGAMQYAITVGSKRPLLGYGFGHAVYGGSDIHNLWLKLWLEAGLLLPMLLAVVIFRLLRSTRIDGRAPRAPSSPSVVTLAKIVLLQGVVISMFEPNALIGSFQATAVWWACAGLVARCRATNPRRGTVPSFVR